MIAVIIVKRETETRRYATSDRCVWKQSSTEESRIDRFIIQNANGESYIGGFNDRHRRFRASHRERQGRRRGARQGYASYFLSSLPTRDSTKGRAMYRGLDRSVRYIRTIIPFFFSSMTLHRKNVIVVLKISYYSTGSCAISASKISLFDCRRTIDNTSGLRNLFLDRALQHFRFKNINL